MDEQNDINVTSVAPENEAKKDDKGQKNILIAISVIAVVALILAGFFFVNYKNAQNSTAELEKQAQEAAQKIEMAKDEIQQAVEETADTLATDKANMAAREAELQATIEAQQDLIDAANAAAKESGATLIETCENLKAVMPPENTVVFRSSNWDEDIYAFQQDLLAEMDTYGSTDPEYTELENDLKIVKPYSNNFMAQCETVYDTETGAVGVVETAPTE